MRPLRRTEAKGLICPFSSDDSDCCADSCMAWEWTSQRSKMEITDRKIMAHEGEPPRPAHVPDSWLFEFADDNDDGISSWFEPDAEAINHWRGVCRLIERGHP